MNYSPYFKLLAQNAHPSQELDESTFHALYSALFDGGLAEIEMGALIAYSAARRASAQEMLGLQRAMAERATRLRLPQRDLSPVVIATYSGTTNYPNLTALLALLLQRYEIPVLLHGTIEGYGGVVTAYVLREFNLFPSGTAQRAQACLNDELLAFVPTAVLSPGLAQLLALRSRLGVANQDYFATVLLDPFAGQGLHLCNVSDSVYGGALREAYRSTGRNALLFRGTDGEPFVNPDRRPAIEWTNNGECITLFEEEPGRGRAARRMAQDVTLRSTAAWIKQALAGEVAIPHPILNQLACCLYASGYTTDIQQAKAIAAMAAVSMVAA